ncbi:hypothetical protein [Candidatus Enterovibrio escicola]|uniref:hypothetical protein n=1 Tax=Candidatus Enterovibrio escicola TaxID=1927127 RepID=UPI001237B7CF|nr:hypothetical protein [Candidatus Enterovibrio escacola]
MTVFVELEDIYQIEHSQYRSGMRFRVNLITGFITYTFPLKKPSLGITRFGKATLTTDLRLNYMTTKLLHDH